MHPTTTHNPIQPLHGLRIWSRCNLNPHRAFSPYRHQPRHAIVETLRRSSSTSFPNTTSTSTTNTYTTATATDDDNLSNFLSWLIANGVEGIGHPTDSKIALFNGENGERGIVAIAPLRKGESFAKIPLRLAITDFNDNDNDNSDSSAAQKQKQQEREQHPWSVRLAMKLIDYAMQGDTNPWAPYLRVLPPTVPSPLTQFTWEDTKSIAYEPARREYDATVFLSTSFASLSSTRASTSAKTQSPHDGGGSSSDITQDTFDWALSVVHSRTFGTPMGGRRGAVIRMLVPLVDFLNHAGDQEFFSGSGSGNESENGSAVVATDNVRWDIVRKLGAQQEYVMILTTTRDIQQGEELLLSYGERSNDDFFIHYGFVPPRNVHDSVVLFENIETAIDWLLDKYIPLGKLTPNELQTAIHNAYVAATGAGAGGGGGAGQQDEAFEAMLEEMPPPEADKVRREREAITLFSRGRTDARLVAAIESIHAVARGLGSTHVPLNCQDLVREAVAERAAHILRSMASTTSGNGARLERDIQELVSRSSSSAQEDEADEYGWREAEARYLPAIDKLKDRVYTNNDGDGAIRDVKEEKFVVLAFRAYKAMILWDAIMLALL